MKLLKTAVVALALSIVASVAYGGPKPSSYAPSGHKHRSHGAAPHRIPKVKSDHASHPNSDI